MRNITRLAALAILVLTSTSQAAAPQLINFQSLLADSAGSPVADGNYSVVFTIWDAAAAGTSVWTETQNVTTSGGLFNVLLGSVSPVEDTVFNGTTRYLGIAVDGDPELSPRAAMVSVPYSQRVNTVDGASGGNITSKTSIGPGHILTGDSAAIGGGHDNTASGLESTVSGGHGNTASDHDATVGGGFGNTADSVASTVGGGITNIAMGSYATVTGGQNNTARNPGATVAGGESNLAGAPHSTVAGGLSNLANGNYSFAAGRRAKANHFGSFVWADGSDADFATTSSNQFLIRADGGVGIGTTIPTEQLDVGGNIHASGTISSGASITIDGTTDHITASSGTLSFGVDNISIGGNIVLDTSTAVTGNIYKGGSPFLHDYGTNNTFVGDNAGNLTETGFGNNTAIGYSALLKNATGAENSAVGIRALENNTSGQQNSAVGAIALHFNTNGNFNTAVGDGALVLNTSGEFNSSIGHSALATNTTGQQNTAVGVNADVTSGALTNATAVGYNAKVNASNKVRIGNASVTVIEGQIAYTFTSDRNEKEKFQPLDGEVVLRKIRGFESTSWNYKGQDASTFRHYGPMAQDFFAAFGHDGVGQCGDSTTMNSGDEAGILFAAVQALEKRTSELARDEEINALRSELDQLKLMMTELLAERDASTKIKLGMK